MPNDDPREDFLPKEPKDLPREPIDLPLQDRSLPTEPATVPPHTQTPHETPQYSHEVKTVLSWSAAGRPFRKRGKQYYLTALLIAIFIEIILFLFAQYSLMMVVASLVFVTFALAYVPPHNFHYRVSTEGITIEDHFFLWQELYDFYFKKREGLDVLHVRTHALIPGELVITLGEIDREHVKAALARYLPYREVVKPTFMEKSGDWLSRNFPLERTPEKASS